MYSTSPARSDPKPRLVARPQARSIAKVSSGTRNGCREDETKTDSIGRCSSSDSSSCGCPPARAVGPQLRGKRKKVRPVKIVPEGVGLCSMLDLGVPVRELGRQRCSWITPNSDPLYVAFHDREWGVPVHDDRKLFELLIFSEALAELSWSAILNNREKFRNLFDNFDPCSVADLGDRMILPLKSNGRMLLSEQKLRAVVENARQMLKVMEEFGSFSYYCWSFVNHKPITSQFKFARHLPAKTPKAESFSKDLMRRGFRCVGPSVVYSFMQAAGIVNDHLTSCFRHEDCISSLNKDLEANNDIPEHKLDKA